MDQKRYLVAGATPWARRAFDQHLTRLPGAWTYTESLALTLATSGDGAWDAAFFLHWRARVPARVLSKTACIGFHLGDFAAYRGGSPLQHQILAGEDSALVTMYRMTDELDAGPVYDTQLIDLHGSAEAIYARAMWCAVDLIERYVEGCYGPPQPPPRLAPLLARRTPDDSRLLAGNPAVLEDAYDFVRMLDAEDYPPAFLDYGGLRLTFRRAVLYDGRIECDCTITEKEE